MHIHKETKKIILRFNNGYKYNTHNWFSIGLTPGFNQYYGDVYSKILTVKYDPTNLQIIYFEAAYGDIWKNINIGQSWTPKIDFEISLFSCALTIDPNYAYVGLLDLWRTTNGKDFYKITNTSAGPVHIDHHNVKFHPTDPNKLIAATDGGLYYSTIFTEFKLKNFQQHGK